MRYLVSLSVIALVMQQSVAPPVTHNKKDDGHKEEEVEDNKKTAEVMEYHRYLMEVVQALESDPDFRSKLEKAEEVDIRTGKIAHELQFVNHKIRTKLDELKREELERLRHLATKDILNKGLDLEHLKIAEHLDHSNSRTFEINDLKKLIAKTTKDLAEVDRQRRQEFKEYEMQKKFEEEQKMKGNTGMNEEERKQYETKLHAMKEKHKKHQPLHHPGSKQQLEEVWEKQDHMENQDFDPRTFFYLHDVDGNGMWDQNEVKALFLKELDKLYAENTPEDDLIERAEEMERMREHVFNEADLNKDGLISYEEFLEQTKKPGFQQDSGWEGLDEQQIYSQQEYEAFERRQQEEIQRMISKGILSPHLDNMPTHQEQFPPQYDHVPSVDHGVPQPPQQQYHGQPPQQQYHGQPPQQQYHGHVPQQQYHGQPPQQPVQVPHYQGQVPQQVHGQVPMQPDHHVPIPQQPMYQGQVHQPQYQQHVPEPHYQEQPQYQQQQQQPPQYQQQVPQHNQQHVPQQNQQHVPQQNQHVPQPNQQQAQLHNVQQQIPQQPNPHIKVVPQQNVQNQPSQQQPPQQQQQQQQQQPQKNTQAGQEPIVQKPIQQNAIPQATKV